MGEVATFQKGQQGTKTIQTVCIAVGHVQKLTFHFMMVDQMAFQKMSPYVCMKKSTFILKAVCFSGEEGKGQVVLLTLTQHWYNSASPAHNCFCRGS